jgi:hypothetical protein
LQPKQRLGLSEDFTDFAIEVVKRNHKHKYRKDKGWLPGMRQNEIGNYDFVKCLTCGKVFDVSDYESW